MASEGEDWLREALTRAERTIAEQTAEIERLRAAAEGQEGADELRRTLSLAATAGTLAAPVSHDRLLEMIVQTAMHLIDARAGALLLVDQEAQELVFQVAVGGEAAEVKKLRVPLGHGVAGLVALTGQPLAITNAQADARQARDIAEATGYRPESLLCVPLFYGDQVVGVLELLDKQGNGAFTPDDIGALGLFADQAAVTIEQSQASHDLGRLLSEALSSLDEISDHEREQYVDRARDVVAGIEQDSDHRRALELARLVSEIAARGEDESRACERILQAFADYLRSRPTFGSELGTM